MSARLLIESEKLARTVVEFLKQLKVMLKPAVDAVNSECRI